MEVGDGPVGSRWETWKDQFIAYLALKQVENHDEKFRALMCFGGPDVRKIIQDVYADEGSILDNRFRAAMGSLDDYYAPRLSLRYERFKFRQLQFSPNEKLERFVIRLKTQAALCGFGEQTKAMIMDQIVYATKDDKLRAKYLEADTSLEEMINIGRTYESVSTQVKEFRGTSSNDATPEVNVLNREYKRKLKSCNRCSGNHQSDDRQCPARLSRCNKCMKMGHYARCCKSNLKKEYRPIKEEHASQFSKYQADRSGKDDRSAKTDRLGKEYRKPKFVREVDDVTNKVEIRELFHLDGKRSVTATVGGVNVKFIVDTGADEDVLGVDDWKMLKRVGFEAFDIRKGSDKIFRAYGSLKPLTVLGEVDVNVQIGDVSCSTTLFVIEDGKCSLLSGNTAEKLGVVKFLHTLTDGELPYITGMIF